jgi:hypothetical protein
MLRVEENKLIIEIETSDVAGTLTDYRNSLIEAIKYYRTDNQDDITVYSLGNLLKELLPTFEQNKLLLNSTN